MKQASYVRQKIILLIYLHEYRFTMLNTRMKIIMLPKVDIIMNQNPDASVGTVSMVIGYKVIVR